MAAKFLITEGIGLTPGNVKYIVLDGLETNPSTATTANRKTLSMAGTKTGTRQMQGSNN